MSALLRPRAHVLRPAFCREAQDFFRRAVLAGARVRPTQERSYERLLRGAKRQGVLQKLEAVHGLGAGFVEADAAYAKLNLVSAGLSLVAANAPTFTPGRGFKGDGVSSSLSISPATTTFAKLAQDSMMAGIFVRQAASYDGATGRIDWYGGASRLGRRATTATQYVARFNDSTSSNLGISGQTGHIHGGRLNSTDRELWRELHAEAIGAAASVTVSNRYELLAASGTGFSDAELSFAWAGAYLDAVERAHWHRLVVQFLRDTGAYVAQTFPCAAQSSTSDLGAYTFSTVSIFDEAPDRFVIVPAFVRRVGQIDFDAVTVGGITASAVVSVEPNSEPNTSYSRIALFIVNVPTGTTADIVVDPNQTSIRCAAQPIVVYGIDPNAIDTAATDSNVAVDNPSVSIDARRGGVIVAFACSNATSGGVTWSGATEYADAAIESNNTISAAAHGVLEDETGRTIQATFGAAGSDQGLIAASFRLAA